MKLGISHQRPEELTSERFDALHRLGIEAMEVRTLVDRADLDSLGELKSRVETAGFEIHEIMLDDLYSADSFTLATAERDRDIERLCQFVTDLGTLGIRHTTYAWNTGGSYQTGTTTTRGCETREFRASVAEAMPKRFTQSYDDAFMWDTYRYFMDRVLPVAEAANVRLQLHPNDPPMSHQGIARIFRSTAAFSHAMDLIEHHPNAGVLFCVGTWAEMLGPDGQGENINDAIRQMSDRITQVHFRNTSGHLPDFHETFPDNGYVNLLSVLRTLREVGFNGMVVPDHVPGGGYREEAYTFGYIRGLLQATEG